MKKLIFIAWLLVNTYAQGMEYFLQSFSLLAKELNVKKDCLKLGPPSNTLWSCAYYFGQQIDKLELDKIKHPQPQFKEQEDLLRIMSTAELTSNFRNQLDVIKKAYNYKGDLEKLSSYHNCLNFYEEDSFKRNKNSKSACVKLVHEFRNKVKNNKEGTHEPTF